ncbi:TPA: oligosaccharide flippase family protein [Citrobacter freundii]
MNRRKIWERLKLERGLIENVFSLATLQFFNIIIPILLIPFLYTRVGVDMFAMIMVAQALTAYFVIVIDYGFNLSATRHISINRDNNKTLSEAFSSVMILKSSICVVSFLVYIILVFMYSNYSTHKELFFLFYLTVVGQSLFPSWFFQGVEKMKYITIINAILKIVCSILIFFMIDTVKDYYYYPLIFGIGSIIGACVAIRLACKNYDLKIYIPDVCILFVYLKESTGFFFSRIAVTSYTTLNIIVLSFFASTTVVGYYSIAEKIYMAIRSIYQPVSTALYPYISKNRNVLIFKRIFSWLIIGNFIAVLLLYFLSPWVIKLATGHYQQESIEYLRLFSILILIIMPSIFMGYPLLGAMGYSSVVNRSVIFPSIIHIAIIGFLSLFQFIEPKTIIYTLLFTEIFVLFIRMAYVIKFKIYKIE